MSNRKLQISEKERVGRTARLFILALLLTLAGCDQIERPKVEPFVAVPVPPPKQELRWSNGKAPVSFDPARAAAAPETDIVRAAYEGLTELDSTTLRAVPGVAVSWQSSDDHRTWTFYLRNDARWSNGDPVTAGDFVRSWQRLSEMGDKVANNYLIRNIVGMTERKASVDRETEAADFLRNTPSEPKTPPVGTNMPGSHLSGDIRSASAANNSVSPQRPDTGSRSEGPVFGVTAVDDLTLRVDLELPDKDFPHLVANPIFRPVFGDGKIFDKSPLNINAPTNGAFRISEVEDGSVLLIRSDTYWNHNAIALEQVRFVPFGTAEEALEAYKRGEVDVVTNAPFEPLAVKLLAPFEDFRRTAHNALNFYEVNTERPPFSDRRVRQALALSIDREKLTEGDLQGTTEPAYSFSPLRIKSDDTLAFDINKANDLLEKAGYPNGSGFPPIRLVVNRNDVQQRVANSVARMWKQNLNLDTVIVVKEASEMDEVRRIGDFDLLRRGVVLPTNNELVNLTAVRGPSKIKPAAAGRDSAIAGRNPGIADTSESGQADPAGDETLASVTAPNETIAVLPVAPDRTDEALFDMVSIPLYFPTSYSLVKPYIQGFEWNGLDAPSLKHVSIDNDWQPKNAKSES
jgi:oligopeptide transport system substrate-binding protein